LTLFEDFVLAVEQKTVRTRRRRGRETSLLCPAHDDHDPSLEVTVRMVALSQPENETAEEARRREAEQNRARHDPPPHPGGSSGTAIRR